MRKIEFEDKGQDFLEWTLNDEDKVVDSFPFQTDIWKGTKVFDPEVGERPLLMNDNFGKPRELNYKILKITEL